MIYLFEETKDFFPVVARCSQCNNAKTIEGFNISTYEKLICSKCHARNPIIYVPYNQYGDLDIEFLADHKSGKNFNLDKYDNDEGFPEQQFTQYIESRKCPICNNKKFSSIFLETPLKNTPFGELPTSMEEHKSYGAACTPCGDHAHFENEELMRDEKQEWTEEDAMLENIPKPETDQIPYEEDYDSERPWDIEIGGPYLEDGEFKS